MQHHAWKEFLKGTGEGRKEGSQVEATDARVISLFEPQFHLKNGGKIYLAGFYCEDLQDKLNQWFSILAIHLSLSLDKDRSQGTRILKTPGDCSKAENH